MSDPHAEPRPVRMAIVGSGPAGYTAAIYAARAALKPVLISGMQPGGQLTITTDVENYPGFADVIQGPWLMEQMRAQAEHVGTEMLTDLVVAADLSRRPFRLTLDSGAEKILQERLFANDKVEVLWDREVEEIVGEPGAAGVTGVRLKGVRDGRVETVPTDGVFIAIGHAPASSLFKGQLRMNASGYVETTPGKTHTAIKGVFAAGDVTDDVYRQAVTAAGQGCMAALEAVRLLAEEDHARRHERLSHHEAEKIAVW